MTQKLKPCPFCDSEYVNVNRHLYMMEYGCAMGDLFVKCENCGGCGPSKDSEEEAIKAWNRRAGKE